MFDKIVEWLNNRENVTFLLAVFGSVLSAWNWVEKHFENRKRIKNEIKDVFCFGPDPSNGGYTEALNLYIMNKSREAIALSGMKVICGSRYNRFGEYRIELHNRSNRENGKEVIRLRWFSDIFPVKIEGLGCAHLLVASTGDLKCIESGKDCQIVLYSNKGKIYSKFSAVISDQELLSQCREPSSQTEALLN